MTSCLHYHLHHRLQVWSTGQDQMRIVKQRLLEMIPELSIFLDVDDLEDISDLEGYITKSKMVLIFCSQGYFRSGGRCLAPDAMLMNGLLANSLEWSMAFMAR